MATHHLRIARHVVAYYFSVVITISFKLPVHLLERLDAESRARGTTKSSLIRDCLEQALAPSKSFKSTSCYDLATDLAGSLKGLPSDLATNPEYMKDFGQ